MSARWTLWTTVYPRECGGAWLFAIAPERSAGLSPRVRGALRMYRLMYTGDGLSPRVRGSPHCDAVVSPTARSIPASAGEPTRSTCRRSPMEVYPRECGGADRG